MSSGQRFSGVRKGLENGFSKASGALKKAYTRPRDAIYEATGVTENDGSINQDRRKVVQGISVLGAGLGTGAIADKYSDGELDGNLSEDSRGPLAGLLGNESSQDGSTPGGEPGSDTPTETERPTDTNTEEPDTETSTERPTETETGTESPTDTQTGTEESYSGDVDGSNYEPQAVPGPVEGEGYQVTDELLEDYDSDGWADIIDEEEYQELGTGADWYLQEDAIVGINERQRVSRTFPGNEFGYDTDDLYEDIREEAN